MKTRLARAIAELKVAAGTRPFVLVIEKAHKAAPDSRVEVHRGENMACWEALGILRAGTMDEERILRSRMESS